ncbi:MAG: aldo/keto reductase [Sedimentisphaerales bacterium]|nr:aldo/keto reductase [Sedimentisphaerales bacterium]
MVPQMTLSKNGPACSRLVHGLWRLAAWKKTTSQIRAMIDFCLERGITTFDHADIYGDYACEQLFGAALSAAPVDRSRIQLVTKCGIKLVSPNRPGHRIKSYDTNCSHILASVDNSLKCLNTEYVDVLLIHRPDPLADPDEINEAFVSLRDSGKVRHFGVSNFLPSQFELLASRLEVPLVTNQVEYSVMHLAAHADGTIDLCQRVGIHPMAWSPLGGGRLFHQDSTQGVTLRETLGGVGRDIGGASIDQIALAWILKHPVRFAVVLGTGNTDRINQAVEAMDISLSREQWFEIWRASTGRDVP